MLGNLAFNTFLLLVEEKSLNKLGGFQGKRVKRPKGETKFKLVMGQFYKTTTVNGKVASDAELVIEKTIPYF